MATQDLSDLTNYTEYKIGKWIDGSDLYQRTFVLTNLTNAPSDFELNILSTSGIDIVLFDGYVEYVSSGSSTQKYPLNMYSDSDLYMLTLMMAGGSDLACKYRAGPYGIIDKAVITIKYTKVSNS